MMLGAISFKHISVCEDCNFPLAPLVSLNVLQKSWFVQRKIGEKIEKTHKMVQCGGENEIITCK